MLFPRARTYDDVSHLEVGRDVTLEFASTGRSRVWRCASQILGFVGFQVGIMYICKALGAYAS
eukprot:1336972-Amorphochlora_amoeboformis.AAC.1